MPDQDPTEIVRECYAPFAAADRSVIERTFADDFVFSAPPDVGIDRATFFERCWPHAGRTARFDFVRIFEHDGEVFVTYEATREDGSRFRNSEIFRVAGDQIVEQEVYFGWDLD